MVARPAGPPRACAIVGGMKQPRAEPPCWERFKIRVVSLASIEEERRAQCREHLRDLELGAIARRIILGSPDGETFEPADFGGRSPARFAGAVRDFFRRHEQLAPLPDGK